jgi:outer membrane protein assembly factor BamD (BamD/ComL family)
MYGKVKLSKRQIKEDKFTTFMLNAKHQVVENWQWFVMGTAAVVLVIVAVVYYLNSQDTRQQEAAETLSRAMLEYRNGNTEVALLTLAELTEEYAGSEAAEQATFMLAKMNYDSRNYPEAIRYYEKYINDYPGDELRHAGAVGGIAACYENQGNYSEAARGFVKAVEEYPDGPLEGDYRLAAMRNYLLSGEIESARAQFETIQEKFENSNLVNQATKLFNEKANI